MSVTPGIYTPIVTFYKADGNTIDYPTQIAHAKHLQKLGIAGVVALGSTGENALLSQQERIDIIANLHEAIPDFPIIAGVAQNNAKDAVDTIAAYKKAGATSAMVLPSSYYGPVTTQEGVYDWLTEVADASALPILVYIFPGVCNGLQVLPETVRKLAAHPNIIGCKCTHGDVQQYARIGLDEEVTGNNFALLSGFGQLLLPLYAVGGSGVIDALSGAFPKTFVELFKALESGDTKKAQKLQFVVSEAEVLAGKGNFLSIKRAIRDNLGFGESLVGRKPMNYGISDEDWEKEYKGFYDLIKKVEDTL
ncbi:aldolase [Suhomyces tanzawaensis NRRL Y-17324]|uniref:Aldolase n=1 Tax=Suhomyces tanzawaensis NRRL Y-17324 TaxID=984487 RepID=A0A1E4SFM4_9ASCO|nr:aldolase [Suhomyces tanzawaensis NRRL Y-17324]ODV78314.1 aldolase [Suhomyces tanzawaensis NRRL Y-17324]